MYTSDSLPQYNAFSWGGGGSTKVVTRFVKFEIFGFFLFCPFNVVINGEWQNVRNFENGRSWSKVDWNWDSGNTYMGYLWPCSVQGHLRVIRCTCLKMVGVSKMAGGRAKRREIWDYGISVLHICGTFDFVGFVVWCHLAHWSQNHL